jgi:DNA-binding response OmpR family regulator
MRFTKPKANPVAIQQMIRRGQELSKRILLIKKDLDLSDAVQRLLESGGNIVIAADEHPLEDCLSLVKKACCDAIVLEIDDSLELELAQKLRNIAEPVGCPIIALTSIAGLGCVSANSFGDIELPFDAVLEKPFKPDQLLAKIAQSVDPCGESYYQTMKFHHNNQ